MLNGRAAKRVGESSRVATIGRSFRQRQEHGLHCGWSLPIAATCSSPATGWHGSSESGPPCCSASSSTSGRWSVGKVFLAALIAAVLQSTIGPLLGVYRRQQRFGGFDEMAALLPTLLASTAILWAITSLVFDPVLVPASVSIGGGMLAMTAMAAVRYAWRLYIDNLRRPSADTATSNDRLRRGRGRRAARHRDVAKPRQRDPSGGASR